MSFFFLCVVNPIAADDQSTTADSYISGTKVEASVHEMAMQGIYRMGNLELAYGQKADKIREIYYKVMTAYDNKFHSTTHIVREGPQTIIFAGQNNDVANIFGQAQQSSAD